MLSRAKRSETDRSKVGRSVFRLGDGREAFKAELMKSEMEVDASSEVTSLERSFGVDVELCRPAISTGLGFKAAIYGKDRALCLTSRLDMSFESQTESLCRLIYLEMGLL